MEQQDEILDVSRAAVRLGLSPDGVRKRIQRGTLRGQKVGGQWRVILPAVGSPVGSDTTASVSKTVSDSARDALIAHLQQENARLVGIIETQTRTIAELTHRVPELPAGSPPPGPEPPAEMPHSAPETAVTPPKPGGWLKRLWPW